MTDNLPPLQHHLQNFLDCLPGSEKQEITEAIQLYASTAIDAALAARGAVPAGWRPLTDGQWMNIVNLNQAWFGYSVEDAVHAVVKLTEARLKVNNSPAAPQQVAQPRETAAALHEIRAHLSHINKLLDGAVPVAEQWRPIETSPKDSKARLVWCPDRKNCYLVSWDGRYEGEWVLFAAGNIGLSEEPTHWMPIPAAPQKPKD